MFREGVFAKLQFPQIKVSKQELYKLPFTFSFFPFFHLVNIIEHFPSVKGNLISRSRCACPRGAFKLTRKIVFSENLTMTI